MALAGEAGLLPRIYSHIRVSHNLETERPAYRVQLTSAVGFLIIWAKTSDIMGRKTCLTTAIGMFVIASAACAAAQTMTQL